jgi:hypothetical protein
MSSPSVILFLSFSCLLPGPSARERLTYRPFSLKYTGEYAVHGRFAAGAWRGEQQLLTGAEGVAGGNQDAGEDRAGAVARPNGPLPLRNGHARLNRHRRRPRCGAPKGDLPERRRWKVAGGGGRSARVATWGVRGPAAAASANDVSPGEYFQITRWESARASY